MQLFQTIMITDIKSDWDCFFATPPPKHDLRRGLLSKQTFACYQKALCSSCFPTCASLFWMLLCKRLMQNVAGLMTERVVHLFLHSLPNRKSRARWHTIRQRRCQTDLRLCFRVSSVSIRTIQYNASLLPTPRNAVCPSHALFNHHM